MSISLSLTLCICSKRLHELYAGDKNLILVEGDHNSNRPAFMFASVGIFLANTLQVRWVG